MGRPKLNTGNCLLCNEISQTKGLCSAHYKKQYYNQNKEKESKSRSDYNKAHPEKMAERKRNREKVDICYKLANRLRTRLNEAIKQGGAIRNLGCSVEDLKKHLEIQFEPGMNWNNHTNYGWHIDHIKPLVNFDLTKEDQLKEACHYSNLRPLWWDKNLGRRYGKES